MHWILIVLDTRKTCPWPAAAWNQSKTNQLTDLVWDESFPTDKFKNPKGEELLIPFSAADLFFIFLQNPSFKHIFNCSRYEKGKFTFTCVFCFPARMKVVELKRLLGVAFGWCMSQFLSVNKTDYFFVPAGPYGTFRPRRTCRTKRGACESLSIFFSAVWLQKLYAETKWLSGNFSFCPFCCYFFAVQPQGKQGEPGPSGKAGLPGTPVSVTPCFLAT